MGCIRMRKGLISRVLMGLAFEQIFEGAGFFAEHGDNP
jgi:hypothetical protein